MKTKPKKRLSFEERHNIILETATELFAKYGFDATTTQSIAKKCAINEALIFRHFPTKNKLYDAILDRKVIDYKDKLSAFDQASGSRSSSSIQNLLLDLAKFIVAENKRDSNCLRMMIFASLQHNEAGLNFFNRRMPLVELTESCFKELATNIRFSKNLSPQTCARLFLSTVYHYIFITELFGAKKFYCTSESNALKNIVTIFIKGVAV